MSFQDVVPAPDAPGVPLLLRLGETRHRTVGSPGCEIAPCPARAEVPGCPGWLLGMVIHKGEALPLVDLAAALDDDVPVAGVESRRMLVNRSGNVGVAFLVDDVDVDDGREGVSALDLDAVARDLLARSADWAAA